MPITTKKYPGDSRLREIFGYIKTELDKKVNTVSGKGLSTEDYTSAEKTKLEGIASGAEVNVQSDWNETNSNSDAFILNKPSADSLLTALPVWTATPTDDTYLLRRDTAGAASYGQVKFSTVWDYIKGKADSAYLPKSTTIPTKTSQLTNDSGFLTSHQTLYESNLNWGNKNFSGSYGPIDAALMDELGANRLQFVRAGAITVEYSRDGGSTWTDYGASAAAKQQIFAQGGSLSIGKADSSNKATTNGGKYKLRITIDTGAGSIYSFLNKFVIYCSTSGSAGSYCQIQIALQSSPTTFVNHTNNIPISGWSGYNVINTGGFTTYGNTPGSQYGRIRFIFGDGTGGNTSYNGLNILQIKAFGGVGWTTPSTMAKTRHLYSYDDALNASFPAQVTATRFNGAVKDAAADASTTFAYSKAGLGYGDFTWLAAWNGYELRAVNKSLFTYNFSGVSFVSGKSDTGTHDANTALTNGHYYYTSNGPATTLGASTTDGALYVQSHSDSWVAQIAQDYRNGCLFVRGKNNGTWKSWNRVLDTAHTIDTNTTMLPQFSGAPSYLVGIEAFTSGGTMKWQSAASVKVGSADSATKATQDGDGNTITSSYVRYKGNLSSDIGSGTPATSTKTYWENSVPNTSVQAAYNTSGAEYSLLFSRGGSASYGSILKWGYTDAYLYILRTRAGNWETQDWEKISAGYADKAGTIDIGTGYSSLWHRLVGTVPNSSSSYSYLRAFSNIVINETKWNTYKDTYLMLGMDASDAELPSTGILRFYHKNSTSMNHCVDLQVDSDVTSSNYTSIYLPSAGGTLATQSWTKTWAKAPTKVSSTTASATVSGVTVTVNFELYSNGMKCIEVASSNAATAQYAITIPAAYRSSYMSSSRPGYFVGFNTQYASSSTSVARVRCFGITADTLIIYASPYTGCWGNFYYI